MPAVSNNKKITSIKEIQGTVNKSRERKKGKKTPKTDGNVKKPAYLKGNALKEWKRVVPLLESMNVLGKIDSSMLGVYCQMYGEFVDALKTDVPKGVNFIAQLRYMANQFGLTPLGRESISAQEKKDKENPFSEF